MQQITQSNVIPQVNRKKVENLHTASASRSLTRPLCISIDSLSSSRVGASPPPLHAPRAAGRAALAPPDGEYIRNLAL